MHRDRMYSMHRYMYNKYNHTSIPPYMHVDRSGISNYLQVAHFMRIKLNFRENGIASTH